jgi:hypothetical protein
VDEASNVHSRCPATGPLGAALARSVSGPYCNRSTETHPRSGGQLNIWKEGNPTKNRAAPAATGTLPFPQKASDLEKRPATSHAPPYPVIGPFCRCHPSGIPLGSSVGLSRWAIRSLGRPIPTSSGGRPDERMTQYFRKTPTNGLHNIFAKARPTAIPNTCNQIERQQQVNLAVCHAAATSTRIKNHPVEPRDCTLLAVQTESGNRENSRRRCWRWPARHAGEPPINIAPMSIS